MANIDRIAPDGVYKPFRNIYSQVVKATGGTIVHVAGTVANDESGVPVGKGDMAAQAEMTWENIGKSLAAAGATPQDVIKINTYVTDVAAYIEHGIPVLEKFFGDKRPVSTLVEVPRLVNPDWMVEVEATAIID
jgi:enamine deaminase RidA (YjgF/YER057c/UK114 family)